jgi:hypothetical protein
VRCRWYPTLAIRPPNAQFPDDAAVFGDGNGNRRNRFVGDQAPDLACNPLEACVGVCRRVRHGEEEEQEQQETEDGSANHQVLHFGERRVFDNIPCFVKVRGCMTNG